MKILKYFLIFIPISIISNTVQVNEELVFITVCLSIIPLSGVIGNATEQISLYTGSKIGGLISATMSNVPELMIGYFSVKAGLYNIVLASMAGAIISNILLVLGVSMVLGGMKRKFQTFDKNVARSNYILLAFAAMSIIIPFALKYAIGVTGDINLNYKLKALSISIAIILLVIYIAGLIFSFVTHRNVFVKHLDSEEESESPKWGLRFSLVILICAAFLVAIESEMLVNSVQHVIKSYELSEVFIGIVLIPILGNVAENVSAIIMAVKNKIDICIEIAIGSSIQIALFVAPILIIISFIISRPLVYVYDLFEVVSILIAIVLSLTIVQDGKTNWLEGVVLIGCYMILGVSFYYI